MNEEVEETSEHLSLASALSVTAGAQHGNAVPLLSLGSKRCFGSFLMPLITRMEEAAAGLRET